jgi:hypothetical protein
MKTRQWNKLSETEWQYATTGYGQIKVYFEGKGTTPRITTDGPWYFSQDCPDELINALTYVREEVYGKR